MGPIQPRVYAKSTRGVHHECSVARPAPGESPPATCEPRRPRTPHRRRDMTPNLTASPALPTARPHAPYTYAGALASSEKIHWRVEDLNGGDKRLDFSKPFLPESLAGVSSL